MTLPFMHLDLLNVAKDFEDCPDDLRVTMIVSHTEDEESALLDIQHETDILTEFFCSLGRDDFTIQVADLCCETADSLFWFGMR